ncbi:hypothetical protein ACOZB4_02005 [Paenibacillus sp. NPDC058898]|uniref:hypothetical protein n=1 Tax=Paenibacillus sp. NPDC058898 TaxID=3346669 RepID=UPI003BF52D84
MPFRDERYALRLSQPPDELQVGAFGPRAMRCIAGQRRPDEIRAKLLGGNLCEVGAARLHRGLVSAAVEHSMDIYC